MPFFSFLAPLMGKALGAAGGLGKVAGGLGKAAKFAGNLNSIKGSLFGNGGGGVTPMGGMQNNPMGMGYAQPPQPMQQAPVPQAMEAGQPAQPPPLALEGLPFMQSLYGQHLPFKPKGQRFQ